MTARSFRYTGEQWRRLEAIVERAGGADGAVARNKFNERHAAFEKMVGGWKVRIANWNGYTWGGEDTDTYERIARASRELNSALAELHFPPIFVGHPLVWKAWADTRENWKRFDDFRQAIEHVGARAAQMATPMPKRILYARDLFFLDLWGWWRDKLGLQVSSNHLSPVVEFIETATEGFDVFQNKETASYTISNVIRKMTKKARWVLKEQKADGTVSSFFTNDWEGAEALCDRSKEKGFNAWIEDTTDWRKGAPGRIRKGPRRVPTRGE